MKRTIHATRNITITRKMKRTIHIQMNSTMNIHRKTHRKRTTTGKIHINRTIYIQSIDRER